MSTASNGRAREHRVRDRMIEQDWALVARSAGSKGPCDLVMVHAFHGLALVQVGTGNKTLGPSDRAKFTALATACNALPLLAVCTPGRPARFWWVTNDTPSTWKEWDL